MIREEDVNWQFWRSCYCAIDRDLLYAMELKPGVVGDQFSLTIILNKTSLDCKRIIKERIAIKSYPLETTKIDIKKDWKVYTDKFYEDFFAAKDAKCNRLNGMIILHN